MQGEAHQDRKVFLEVIEHVAPERWDSYLKDRCEGNDQLYQRVNRLLKAHRELGEFHEDAGSSGPTKETAKVTVGLPLGSRIGPYVLREVIGEGGMGLVYVAEQIEPVRRKVALKIVKPGMATKDVVARFEAERQALAMMDHPNIARVHDGGETESGQPYFVMELVCGDSITEYCDEHFLDTRERLTLFASVCRAVQHAHQKGIIHRDLKPSNILVPQIDGEPVPKVIDFGIAKAFHSKLTEQTIYTQFAQFVGTPLYMSPEQTEMGVADVDTRSDVYSLGVVLYQLLTGETPFCRETFEASGFDRVRRLICEQEPARPSACVSTLAAEATTSIVERRRTTLPRLTQELRGELDSIVLKCLEKDRTRRYESASALVDDVERFLNHEPIAARLPSAAYRIRKFVRRNRVLVASTIGVFVALSVGFVASTIAFLHAGEQRNIAIQSLAEVTKEQENNRELIKLLRRFYPNKWGISAQGINRTVYESIEEIAPTLSTDLRDYPEVEIQVRQIFADAYTSARQYTKAREQLRLALERAEAMSQGRPLLAVAEIHAALADEVGWNEDEPLDFRALLAHAQQAIEIYESLGVTTGKYGNALFAKGTCLLFITPIDAAEVERTQRKNIEIREKNGDRAVITRWDLGLHLMFLGEHRVDDALSEFDLALQRCQQLGEEPMEVAMILRDQGACQLYQGNVVGAIETLQQAWALVQATSDFSSESRSYSVGLRLVETYFASGQLQKAFGLIDQLERQLKGEPLAIDSLIDCLFLKGWLYYQLEDYAAASDLFERSMEMAEEHFGVHDAKIGITRGYLAASLEAMSTEEGEAARQYRRLIPLTQAYVDRRSPKYDTFQWLHARALLGSARGEEMRLIEAIAAAETGLKLVQETQWECKQLAFHEVIAEAQLRLPVPQRHAAIASLEVGLSCCDEPHATFRSSRWLMPTARRSRMEHLLARLYFEDGAIDEAAQCLEQAVHSRQVSLGANHVQTAMAQLRLGEFLIEHADVYELADAQHALLVASERLKAQPTVVESLRRRVANGLSETYRMLEQPVDAATSRDIGGG